MTAALEARARWHLAIGYAEPVEDDHGEYTGGPFTCWHCGGEGSIVVCMDDLCRGSGQCIHGDGDDMCPVCHGDGLL